MMMRDRRRGKTDTRPRSLGRRISEIGRRRRKMIWR